MKSVRLIKQTITAAKRRERARDKSAELRPVEDKCVSAFMAMTDDEREVFVARINSIMHKTGASLSYTRRNN
jgi:hypothetical protein